MVKKRPRKSNGFRFMVMLTRDRGFGLVGMKPEVASGLIRIKIQASGRDRPGAPGTRSGEHAGADKCQGHGLGAPPSSKSPSCERTIAV